MYIPLRDCNGIRNVDLQELLLRHGKLTKKT